MSTPTRHFAAAAALLSISACTVITEFDRSRVIERNAHLCSDGIDNDGNGLTDCQDFGCLDQDVCCTIPTLAIVDDFEELACAEASCDAPDLECPAIDATRWQAWGAPLPVVCEGALSPNKIHQCYDVGVISLEGLSLRPGLRVNVGIVGAPEIKGRLEAGLTYQDQVRSSTDPCEPVDVVEPVISIRQLADVGGYRFVATFDRHDIGVSELFTDEARREVAITIENDRRVHYAADGAVFAISPAEQPIPASEPEVHLSLSGRGRTAHFDDVSVTAGTQCDAPGAWVPAEQFVALGENQDDVAWDSFAVYAPGVVRTPGGTVRMYYTGCAEQFSECDPLRTGVGRANADANFSFRRNENCPVIGAAAAICQGAIANPFADVYNNLIDLSPTLVADTVLGYASQMADGDEVYTITLFGDEIGGMALVGDPADRIRVGPAGSWDSHEVCCATALERDGVVRVWYAGRDGPSAPWHIGLAESETGVQFDKHPDNPVLTEGAAGAFDDTSVSAPTVAYDDDRSIYRMWYEARGFLGASSIGYAISLDGATWHKYPGNPVISPEDVGLVAVGGPEVLVEGGRMLLWVHGEATDSLGARIYGFVNLGEIVGEPE